MHKVSDHPKLSVVGGNLFRVTAAAMFPAPDVLAAVGAARGRLSELAGAPGAGLWALSSTGLGDALRELLALRAQAEGLLAALAGEADSRGVAAETGVRSSAAWLRAAGRVEAAEARELLTLARVLDPGAPARPGSSPAAGAALRRGEVSRAQAKVIATTMGALPRQVDDEPGLRERAEGWLVEQAAALDPVGLAAAGRALHEELTLRVGAVDVDDPAEAARVEAEADRAAYEQRSITRARHAPGLARVRMLLPEDVAATLFAALDPLAKPRPTEDGVRDQRSLAQRRADAFEDLLAHVTNPDPGGEPGGDYAEPGSDAGPDPEPDPVPDSNHNAGSGSDRAWTQTAWPVPGLGSGRGSDDGSNWAGLPAGRPAGDPQVVVTVAWETLLGAAAQAGVLDTGEALTPAQLRGLLCRAEVIPVVLGGNSEPLDVGRARRAFSRYQRAAMLARDGGCAGLGCDPHPRRAHAHHLREWGRHHGPTDTAQGALFCPSWHRRIHAEGWTVRMAANGHPELIPPAWVDPARRPRQNHRFRDLGPLPQRRPPPPRM